MNFLHGIIHYVVPFLLVLTPLVFVHELGHYLVARFCKVKIETFSIGFGPELFGFNDRTGTRWKFSLLPLGGYVKMFGDRDITSTTVDPNTVQLSEEDKKQTFWHKTIGQRAAVTAAGPIANYLLAILVLGILFMTAGQPYSTTQVGDVLPDSAASAAGIQKDDVVRSVDGVAVDRFEDLQRIIALNSGTPTVLTLDRQGHTVTVTTTPKITETIDNFGFHRKMARLGISHSGITYRKLSFAQAFPTAVRETYNLTVTTLKALGQIAVGTRSTDELGGPIRIAQMSGKIQENGFASLIWFAALLSINLGLINLFPVPLLDGGHLVFYAYEAIRGKPMSDQAQEIGARIGFALVLSLMVLATWNDLEQMHVFAFIKSHL